MIVVKLSGTTSAFGVSNNMPGGVALAVTQRVLQSSQDPARQNLFSSSLSGGCNQTPQLYDIELHAVRKTIRKS
jgi:hypothetical protein